MKNGLASEALEKVEVFPANEKKKPLPHGMLSARVIRGKPHESTIKKNTGGGEESGRRFSIISEQNRS